MRRPVLVTVVAVLAVTACASAGSDLARIGDVSITRQELATLRTTYAGDVAPGAEMRNDLARLIIQEAVSQQLNTDFDRTIAVDEVDGAYADLEAQLSAGGTTLEQALGPGATDALLRKNAEASALVDALITGLLGDETRLRVVYEGDPAAITQVCAHHILVATEEEARAARARLEDGEDFATVASEVSTDTSPGGDLGCAAASRYVAEFAAAVLSAPVGELVGPVQTQFGFHVIRVDERTVPTFEDVQADPRSYVDDNVVSGLINEWVVAALAAIEITVDPHVGTWDGATGTITPPG